MRRKIVIFSLLLIIILTIILSININIRKSNNDTNNIQRIYVELERKYNATFVYTEKIKDETSGQTYYCFKMLENDSIIIKADTGWLYNSPVPFIPFDIRRYVHDDFSDALKEYITNEKCGGVLDITDMSTEEAQIIVNEIMDEISKQLIYYLKVETGDGIGFYITVKKGNYSEEVNFYARYMIWDRLVVFGL